MASQPRLYTYSVQLYVFTTVQLRENTEFQHFKPDKDRVGDLGEALVPSWAKREKNQVVSLCKSLK